MDYPLENEAGDAYACTDPLGEVRLQSCSFRDLHIQVESALLAGCNLAQATIGTTTTLRVLGCRVASELKIQTEGSLVEITDSLSGEAAIQFEFESKESGQVRCKNLRAPELKVQGALECLLEGCYFGKLSASSCETFIRGGCASVVELFGSPLVGGLVDTKTRELRLTELAQGPTRDGPGPKEVIIDCPTLREIRISDARDVNLNIQNTSPDLELFIEGTGDETPDDRVTLQSAADPLEVKTALLKQVGMQIGNLRVSRQWLQKGLGLRPRSESGRASITILPGAHLELLAACQVTRIDFYLLEGSSFTIGALVVLEDCTLTAHPLAGAVIKLGWVSPGLEEFTLEGAYEEGTSLPDSIKNVTLPDGTVLGSSEP